MKKQIVKFLEWVISLFGPTKKEQVEAWPFPVGHKSQITLKEALTADPFPEEAPKPKKTKPRVPKATTRPAKKAPAAIKTAAKKTAKKAK